MPLLQRNSRPCSFCTSGIPNFMCLNLVDPQADLAFTGIDAEDFNLDGIANLEVVQGWYAPRPDR